MPERLTSERRRAELGVDVVVVGVELIELRRRSPAPCATTSSIDTTISTRRLPSPSAATGHVLNRIVDLHATGTHLSQAYLVRAAEASGQTGESLEPATASSAVAGSPLQNRRSSPLHRMVARARRVVY